MCAPAHATRLSNPRLLFLYPGASRAARLDQARAGDAPREFFYGMLGLEARGYATQIGDTHATPSDPVWRAVMALEIARNRTARVGWSRARVRAIADAFASADVAISFTDGFTIAMGLSASTMPRQVKRLGGFMGLCDLAERARPALRGHVEHAIRQALEGLDHVFFFGEADRREAIRRYGIAPERTSDFLFGVDTDFWCPPEDTVPTGGVVAVGSDPSRDYDTLLAAEIPTELLLLTRLPVRVPPDRTGVSLVRGSLHAGAMTDLELRDLYRSAEIVAVPLHDVWQPTGQSVTMQAMACGRPVVLTRGRGLWDAERFVDGENCILVPPGDRDAWTHAIRRLNDDPRLRARIGAAARETAAKHFSLERMNDCAEALVHRVDGN
jgi:hypothetical protein